MSGFCWNSLGRQRFFQGEYVEAGPGGFPALADHMLPEEAGMVLRLVEMVRRQYNGEDRHAGIELHAHQAVHNGGGDEIVPVDAAVDDKAAGNDRSIAIAGYQLHGRQRDFVGAGDAEAIDLRRIEAALLHLVDEAVAGAIGHVAVPARLDEGDPVPGFFC